MKNAILKLGAGLLLTMGAVSCGENFLDTDYANGIDQDEGITSVQTAETALTGAYYLLFHYSFAGNYALSIGDMPTDIAYCNFAYGHWDEFFTFTFTDTDTYLASIWSTGYQLANAAARIIQGIDTIYDGCDESEQAELALYKAEAYALRGYAQLILTNVFAHQVKVDGEDFSAEPGIVVITDPIEPLTQVSRSTVGESYEAILSDLKSAIDLFDQAGTAVCNSRKSLYYIGRAAVYGLLARTELYLEEWDEARQYASQALTEAGITTLTCDADTYATLYSSNSSNSESLFALAITDSQNWSANSCGTLWSTYGILPSGGLRSLYQETDCRTSIFSYSVVSGYPFFNGGKFGVHSSGNAAQATNWLVNAPEMFLIEAEAELQSTTGSIDNARQALLTVARRDTAITTVDDLPSDKEELMEFIRDERARELFQEGLRLYDLRRWGNPVSVGSSSYENPTYSFENYDISNLVFPIPSDEVNSGFGVEQNDWSGTLPTL